MSVLSAFASFDYKFSTVHFIVIVGCFLSLLSLLLLQVFLELLKVLLHLCCRCTFKTMFSFTIQLDAQLLFFECK